MNDVSKLIALFEKNNIGAASLLTIGGDDGFEVKVKRHLNADDMAHIANEVCEAVAQPDIDSFRAEWKDFFIRVAVLETYAGLTLPDGEDRWNIVYSTPLFAMITGHERRPVIFNGHEYDDNRVIDVEQYEQLLAAIDQKIECALRHGLVSCAYSGMADVVADLISAEAIGRGCAFHAS